MPLRLIDKFYSSIVDDELIFILLLLQILIQTLNAFRHCLWVIIHESTLT
ncbi:unnamed protein product [Paramecium primaurelia]|uniref:Uncharacterized protein n=1 Tax=Paramecium primaurelia TaxID=5886 RepID=A0A8S1PGY4_PARPR|nr:unnamed protein product [Paramecium primaurelia]